MDMSSLADWVSGIGSLAVAVVALMLGKRANDIAREDRRARVRDRTAMRLADLIAAVERDFRNTQDEHGPGRSVEAAAACRVLWRYRNWFGTTWAYYCEPEQHEWIEELRKSGELAERMRNELVEALDKLDYQDEQPDPDRARLVGRAFKRIGSSRAR